MIFSHLKILILQALWTYIIDYLSFIVVTWRRLHGLIKQVTNFEYGDIYFTFTVILITFQNWTILMFIKFGKNMVYKTCKARYKFHNIKLIKLRMFLCRPMFPLLRIKHVFLNTKRTLRYVANCVSKMCTYQYII